MIVGPGEALELARIQERWPGEMDVRRLPNTARGALIVTTKRGDRYKIVRTNPEVGADDGRREVRTHAGSKKPEWAKHPIQEIPF